MLNKDIGNFSDFQRARRGLRLPVVASRTEIKAVMERLIGREHFMGALLYGTGIRINELLRLRVQDVDFDQSRLIVGGVKGDKDRYVPFPAKYREEMRAWLQWRQTQYLTFSPFIDPAGMLGFLLLTSPERVGFLDGEKAFQ